MANDARENYKAVFGVYPNESRTSKGGTTEGQAPDFALGLESTANDLYVLWKQSRSADVSNHAQELLKQIQAAVVALRDEMVRQTSAESPP
jgi:hypothetical protein